jgi:transposase-like protein
MSTDQPTDFSDSTDERGADNDPYGVVPDGFCRAWNATSIPEALRKAEKAPSTTPQSVEDKCPECGSCQVRAKQGNVTLGQKDQKIDTQYQCNGCGTHFDNTEDTPGRQVTLWDAARSR